MSPPSTIQSAAPAEDNRWFAEEVHPHDGQLKAYLRGSFPAVKDVEDVVQESYLRIWKAKTTRPILSAKAFLFRVARNIALDLLRRSSRSPIAAVDDLASLFVLEEKPGVLDRVSIGEKLAMLAAAIADLPPRCRELILLCRIKGMSHREAADRLGIAEKTADEHICRGLKRLGEELRKRGVNSYFGP